MKFFHLSDLHIGKHLHHYNLKEEQQYILDRILLQIQKEKPDAVLLCGDIYDSTVPSAEAVEVFDEFLTKLSRITPKPAVLIIAGNHDNGKRLAYANEILKDSKIYIAGTPPMYPEEHLTKVTLEDEYGPVDFYLLPFTKPSHVRAFMEGAAVSYQEAVSFLIDREEIDRTRRNVILSHQFYLAAGKEPLQSDSEMHTVGGLDQVDVSVLEAFDYAALGHIHKPQCMGADTVRYCGTMFAYSVSEAKDEKSITVVTLEEKGTLPIVKTIPLKPKHRVLKLTGTLLEVLNMANESLQEDFVSITLTDDIDPYYPKERLEELYHRILEIQVDNARTRKIMDFAEVKIEVMNPKESFFAFFKEMNGRSMTEDESRKMEQIILKCQEGV